MGNLLHFRKKSSITITREESASLDQLEDHRLLSLYAKTQGLSYREYRTLMGIHNISLETAIQNAREGITILDYIKARERRSIIFRRTNRFLATIGGLAAALLIYAVAPETNINPNRNSICQEYLDAVVQHDADETTRGQTEYYCLLAQQTDPENNAYKTAVESAKNERKYAQNYWLTRGEVDFFRGYVKDFGFSN